MRTSPLPYSRCIRRRILSPVISLSQPLRTRSRCFTRAFSSSIACASLWAWTIKSAARCQYTLLEATRVGRGCTSSRASTFSSATTMPCSTGIAFFCFCLNWKSTYK